MNGPAHNRRIAPEFLPPEVIADERQRMTVRLAILFDTEYTAELGIDA
jgi:hypothetical protein